MKIQQKSAGVVVFEFPVEVNVDLDEIIAETTTVKSIVDNAIRVNKAELTKTIDELVQERADAIVATRA